MPQIGCGAWRLDWLTENRDGERAHGIKSDKSSNIKCIPSFFGSKLILLCNITESNNGTTLRTLYYSPVDVSSVKEQQIRCGEHSDFGSFTLLFQDTSGGLEVMHRSGQYISAPLIPGTVLVNIADLMQRWTSDFLVSTKHRVLLPPDAKRNTLRQSVAFFVHPDDDVIVSCCHGSNKYPAIGALEYLMQCFSSSY
ncbi:uncharacterized protein SI:DKEY-10O6.2 [Latimeria chalumnae]|uniref:uncharacterized protein SI:DKEY-10O6.2 n=1 Tax=Latimeria chalumnae TaxID=7897 RepID=UPI0006D9336E|nr:PREDICTED: UPF0676 protein C1494.01-like [Latimeria chalumnae]|eukprot:XP_014340757.1 PREDICTED: UPF0676 protein C1494.01-like [Latimeria chalumnae]